MSGTGLPGLAAVNGRRWEKSPPAEGIMLNTRRECRKKALGRTGEYGQTPSTNRMKQEGLLQGSCHSTSTWREFSTFACGSWHFWLRRSPFNLIFFNNNIWFDYQNDFLVGINKSLDIITFLYIYLHLILIYKNY